jgi:hypothetical protein
MKRRQLLEEISPGCTKEAKESRMNLGVARHRKALFNHEAEGECWLDSLGELVKGESSATLGWAEAEFGYPFPQQRRGTPEKTRSNYSAVKGERFCAPWSAGAMCERDASSVCAGSPF